MSAESGRGAKQYHGQRVRPEPVIEKSFVENVAGFINEVVPQTYNNPSHYEGKERINWVKFDHCDINDLSLFKDSIECNGNAPSFLLIIGYTNGVQAWVIPGNGEAIEVFSWRQGPVRTLKLLVSPNISATSVDRFSLKRPILAICDAAGPCPQYHSVSFISLKTGEQLKTIKFKSQVLEIYANKIVIVITFPERLAVFEATTLEDLFTISTCYKCPNLDLNPIALGEQWLAFADRRLLSVHQSCGGMVLDSSQSYKSTMIYAAKSITKGLKELGETVASNFMGQKSMVTQPQSLLPSTTPGAVTVVDVQSIVGTEIDLSSGSCPGLVAHFLAHNGTPIVALQFDSSGMLLATADKLGHSFHLFRIQPHPLSSSQAAVHHLYTLYRGDTTARVIDISFSLDARWLAISTHRGTTHVYAVTPYGGKIGMRTHKSVCVVNRLSRFQKSAGLDDYNPSSGRNSPVLSASPGMSKFTYELCPTLAYPNPRYPPYPLPVVLKPLIQLRQPLLQNLIETIASGPSSSHSPPASKSTKVSGMEEIIKVASTFGPTRGWLAGSPTVHRESKKYRIDSLFVMAYHGNLIEYHLEPKPISNLPQEKVSENSPIELEVHATAQWSLVRESTSYELRPPLPSDSPLFVPDMRGIRATSPSQPLDSEDPEEKWMAQVEIYTHAGPPRRLWMGPQFTFKTLPSSGGVEPVGDPFIADECTDPSLTFPCRSSPVAMPISRTSSACAPVHIDAHSLTGSQSPRLSDRCSVDSDFTESENSMTRLKIDLADAMLDTPATTASGKRDSSGGTGKVLDSPIRDDQGFDFSDIMDISCDPPGFSSSMTTVPSSNDRPAPPYEEHIQAVTAKLHQVAVTNQSSAADCASPFWGGSRTPSLEECRAMTSSAEELASTLEDPNCGLSSFAWTPIEPPEPPSFSSVVERPQAHRKGTTNSKADWESHGIDFKQSLTVIESNSVYKYDASVASKPSWSLIVEGSRQSGAKSNPVPQVDMDLLPAAPKSATTSEDDLWASKEGTRKEKKRRRRKNKVEDEEEDLSSLPPPYPPPPLPEDLSNPILPTSSSPPRIDVEGDCDHFHSTEEFHDSLGCVEDNVTGMQCTVDTESLLLRSVHEGDDLARALEEASSDECAPTRPLLKISGGVVPREADERFPFRETSSDDDMDASPDSSGVRRRKNLSLSALQDEVDDEEDTTTSGDDRRTTSESDVTTSPNPRNSVSSSGKKRKKKKKK